MPLSYFKRTFYCLLLKSFAFSCLITKGDVSCPYHENSKQWSPNFMAYI